MIQNLIFVILFLKILFPVYNFTPRIPLDIIRGFFIPNSVAESLKAYKNWCKRSLILQYIFAQKKLTHFPNFSSLEIENNMLPKHSQKFFSVYNFSSKNVSVWGQKNIYTAPFPDAQELLSWSPLKADLCINL